MLMVEFRRVMLGLLRAEGPGDTGLGLEAQDRYREWYGGLKAPAIRGGAP
jgi:hypothetical protein